MLCLWVVSPWARGSHGQVHAGCESGVRHPGHPAWAVTVWPGDTRSTQRVSEASSHLPGGWGAAALTRVPAPGAHRRHSPSVSFSPVTRGGDRAGAKTQNYSIIGATNTDEVAAACRALGQRSRDGPGGWVCLLPEASAGPATGRGGHGALRAMSRLLSSEIRERTG